MEDKIHLVNLSQRPCVVHYLDRYNKFIIGTYELFQAVEDARVKLHSKLDDNKLKKLLENINFRAGKFILLRGNDVSSPNIEYEFDCSLGGGIFDAKLRYNKVDASYSIYAAHSNGTVGVYNLSLHCGDKICLREHISIANSKLLTSLDLFPEPAQITTVFDPTKAAGALATPTDNGSIDSSSSTTSTRGSDSPSLSRPNTNRFVVGDDAGYITVINSSEHIQHRVTTDGDAIWQVKTLRLASNCDTVIVGAENSSWYVYAIDQQSMKLSLLYSNNCKDFSAGVTSLFISDIFHSNEYDRIELLIGSYDESLQTYHIKLNLDGMSKPDVCHKDTMIIQQGGIWRIKMFKKNNRRYIGIAAMYAGTYILPLDGASEWPRHRLSQDDANYTVRQTQSEETLKSLVDLKSLGLSQPPLHYDVAISDCSRTFCMLDFNNSSCIFKTTE